MQSNNQSRSTVVWHCDEIREAWTGQKGHDEVNNIIEFDAQFPVTSIPVENEQHALHYSQK